MTFLTVLAMLLLGLPFQPSSQQAAATPGPASSHTLIGAAYLGFTPESLAASGYSETEASQILSTIQSRASYGLIDARIAAATAPSPSDSIPIAPSPGTRRRPPTDAEVVRRTERRQVLAAAITHNGAERQARLERCIEGAKVGLPPEIAVACGTSAERCTAATALSAEQRASHLGRPLAPVHATLLNQLRTSSDSTSAAGNLTSTLSAVRSRFLGLGNN